MRAEATLLSASQGYMTSLLTRYVMQTTGAEANTDEREKNDMRSHVGWQRGLRRNGGKRES